MKLLITLISSIIISGNVYSQGLYNNGANIVFSGAAHIYIDNTTNGNYLSVGNGSITASATSSITVLKNWTNNASNNGFSVPDGGVVILGGNAQTVSGSAATAFNNLTLTGNGVKTLAVNQTTVGGQAAFGGVLSVGSSALDLNGNTLNVTNSTAAAITRTSGYIISETTSGSNPSIVKWYHRTTTGSKTYPFGVAGSYIPFTLNITSAMAGATDFVSVSTRATGSDNQPWESSVTHMYSPNVPYTDGTIPAVIDRWWQVDNSSAITADATFSYRGSENTLSALYSPGIIGAQYWAGGWLPDNTNIGSATVVSAGVGAVTASGLTTFGPWVLTAQLSPLPIELLNFDVACNDGEALLNWCTATEKNNDYFTIEQSIDGRHFTIAGTVKGNGTTESKHCYSFSPGLSDVDVNYFRLKQTDYNGRSSSSSIISTESCLKKETNSLIITNNGTKTIGLLVNSTNDDRYEVNIHNSLGQLILQTNFTISKGYNNLQLEALQISNGIYYITVSNFTQLLSSKKVLISDFAK